MFESEIKALRKLSTRNVSGFPLILRKLKLRLSSVAVAPIAELCSGRLDGVDDVERIGFISEY